MRIARSNSIGRTRGSRGQALVMTTLGLFAMCGLMGLAVDLGWSFFIKKSAQAAADAAALAAVDDVLAKVGQSGSLATCPATVSCGVVDSACPSSVSSVATDNLDNGCLYARKNGFLDGVNSGRTQKVRMDAGLGSPAGLGVSAEYWARARVSEFVPQLFSSIFGNTMAKTSARATAIISNIAVDGSLMLLNRRFDATPFGQGVNLKLGGSGSVQVPGGILLASRANTAKGDPDNAGTGVSSSGTVNSAYTYINDPGWVDDPTKYTPAPKNKPDSPRFYDPQRGKGQPTPPASALPNCPVVNGMIDGSSAPIVLAPGNYYAVKVDPKTRVQTATGDPLQIKGDVRFASAASAPGSCTGTAGSAAFGDYIFYGGLTNAGGHAALVVEAGRYFLAGALEKKGGSPNPVMDVSSNMSVTDNLPAGKNTTPGEIFVLTDATYPALTAAQSLPATLSAILPSLKFGTASLQAGSGAISLNLHGLNGSAGAVVSAGLDHFDKVLFWQDQRNSTVRYDAAGNIVCGDGNDGGASSGCNTALTGESAEFKYQGSSTTQMYGVIYQPRGAYMKLIGGNSATDLGKLQLITGAIQFQGSSVLQMQTPDPFTRREVSLVE